MTTENKQLGITLHNWATFRGFMSKDEIDAIETVWKGDEFLEQYREFLENNEPIIIENILPGFFRYEKDDAYYGYFFHESLSSEEVEVCKEKLQKNSDTEITELSVGGMDGTTECYFGMPASDTEFGTFKTRGELLFIPGKKNVMKGVFVHNGGDTGMNVMLYHKERKVVAFFFG